jgi:DNA mismatch endonuclease, patch repair protein
VIDIVDQQTRSRMMSGIRGKNTKPELALRRALHARGFRFRLHSKKVHGRPDLVLPKYRAVVFVHGCFWHQHEGCRYATTPATRSEFWQAKFAANVARDCALRKPEQIFVAADRLAEWLVAVGDTLELGENEASAHVREGEDAGSSR